MFERFQLKAKGGAWHIMARKGAGATTDAAWITLGRCSSQIIAMHVYLALKLREAN